MVGAMYAVNARAADMTMPIKAPPAASANAPASCTNASDFITTNCQLSWYGITVYGAIDVGGGWQSHGASSHDTFPAPASYYIQKMNNSPMWGEAPNAMSQSSIGVKGTEPLGGNFSFIFDWQAGFNPYSLGLANGPGSLYGHVGIPLDQQATSGDSSRAGQWYNGLGYVGISSPSYGTLTVFRQNALTMDGVIAYDPVGASYAFSPLGFSGITCGAGNTEDCRYSTSLKYRVNVGQFRGAALWQFGGYGQNNGSNGAYQIQAGGDIPNLANGTLSFDAIYSSVRDAVSLSLGPGSNNAAGMPIPPFLPQTLTATISDNSSVMLLARYTNGALKLYGGYEWIRYAAPSDPQTAFTDLAGDLICAGCAAINNTNISNRAYGFDDLGNKIFQVMWTGARYAITDDLDVMGGYYHYIQNSFYGTITGGSAPCDTPARAQCAGTFDAYSAVIDWRFAPKWDMYAGFMFSQVSGGLFNGYLRRNNIDPSAGLRFRF
jgi:predicted porin